MFWLLEFCAARAAFATMFTAWSAVVPLLRTDWQLSAWQAGMVQSGYHVGFLISLFSVGFLSDRFGARRIYLVTGAAAVGSGMLFAVFADGFVSALLLYGLTGLCSGGSYTPGLAIVAQRMKQRQGMALGYYLAAASLGYAIGLLIASAVIPLAGWRAGFIVTACFPAFGMLLGWHALRQVPNLVHALPDGHGTRSRLVEVVRNKPAMLSIWGYTFHAWELLGLWAWLPAFLAAASVAGGTGGTQAVSVGATLTALTYLAAVVGSVIGGSLSDRFGRTAVSLAMALCSLLCSFSFGWMVGLPMALLVLVAVFYNVTGVGDSSIHSTTLTELTDPRYLGAAYSLRSVLGFGAGAISPWVFGLVLDWGRAGELPDHMIWGLAWSTLGIGGLLGPVAIWRLRNMPEAARLAGGKR
ncbi:MAG: MFS transporter [Rhodocyclales bacterium]|nr:MFS transporter [Rhodocyclales bacterium]